MIKQALQTGGYVFLAILFGLLAGTYTNAEDYLSNSIDYLILALVFMVFLDAPLKKVLIAVKQPKVFIIAWLTNFALIPVLGYGLSQLFFPDQPLIAIGLAVYFMFPCTDWFLGFTRMANGNTGLGSVLLPVNMLTQLLLYPIYLQWVAQQAIPDISIQDIMSTLFNWFFVPALAALVIKFVAQRLHLPIQRFSSMATNLMIYALVFAIFAVYVHQIVDNYSIFGLILLAVSAFFIINTVFTEAVSKLLRFSYEDHVLYSMTTTARNAPLMLGLTVSALPDQPLIYAALIIGMLIEFPYLALQVMRFRSTMPKQHQPEQQILSEAH